MTDRPIIFSGPMVRALIEGRKTQTRRALKPQPEGDDIAVHLGNDAFAHAAPDGTHLCGEFRLPYAIGDRLWVRETFCIEDDLEYIGESHMPKDGRPIKVIDSGPDCGNHHHIPHYRATEPEPNIVPEYVEDSFDDRTRWTPSIHMPRWASRLTLTVTDVKVERLQEISHDDAMAEGILEAETASGNLVYSGTHFNYPVPPEHCSHYAEHAFCDLWNTIHGPDAWDANPWIVALTFTVEQRNIDA